MQAGGYFCQRHQILTIIADVHGVMVDRAFVSFHIPLQGVRRGGGGDGEAIFDSGFDFSCLFIVIPGDQLQV